MVDLSLEENAAKGSEAMNGAESLVRTLVAGGADVGLGQNLAGRQVGLRRRRGCDCGCEKFAATDRNAHSSGRYRLERGRRHRAGRGGVAAPELLGAGGRSRGKSAAQRRRAE